MTRRLRLSASALKLIGAAAMLCDHLCVILLPGQLWLRYIGRLSMPIFAFFIAEGMRRTSDRGRYILRITSVGAVCQAVYLIAGGDPLYMNILLTYALACALIAAADPLLKGRRGRGDIIAAVIAIGAAAALLCLLDFSYGVWAVLVISAAYFIPRPELRLAAMLVILTVYSAVCAKDGYAYQIFSLASLPLIALYRGDRGMKLPRYFFYIFYPAHLALLWIIRYAIIFKNSFM